MDDRRRKTGTERAERLREDQEVQMHTDGTGVQEMLGPGSH